MGTFQVLKVENENNVHWFRNGKSVNLKWVTGCKLSFYVLKVEIKNDVQTCQSKVGDWLQVECKKEKLVPEPRWLFRLHPSPFSTTPPLISIECRLPL